MKFDIHCIMAKEKNLIKTIGEMLTFLKKDYPNFCSWYNNKVVQGVESGDRKIFIATPKCDKNTIAGVLILKDTNEEKKICTLCVLEKNRGEGIGSAFIELSMEVLKTDKPMITVSERNKELFAAVLSKYNFKETKEYVGYYKKDVSEFAYNGYLVDLVFQAV